MNSPAAARDGLAAGTAVLLFYLLLPHGLGGLFQPGLISAAVVCLLQPAGALMLAVALRQSKRLPQLLFASLRWSPFRFLGAFLVLWGAVSLTAFGWEELLNILHFDSAEPPSEVLIAHAPPLLYGCFGISAVFLAPIAEEVIFRDLFPRGLRVFCSPWAAAVISAMLFAALHFTLRQFLPLAVMGLLLQAAFWRTRSLKTAILLHTLNNLVSFTVLSLAFRW